LTTASDRSDLYRTAVDALLAEEPAQAVRLLESVPVDERSPEARFVLARALLETGRADEAIVHFDGILSSPPEDRGEHAFLLLLAARALVACGRRDEAHARLSAAAQADPRMERPARALARELGAPAPPASA
jgi:hypothetical protein